MTTPTIPNRPALYYAARRFIDEGLRWDGCMFDPGRSVWRLDVIDDFHERFVLKGDYGEGTFKEKLTKQLAGAHPDVAQYVGELLFVHSLAADGMRGKTVEGLVRTALDAVPGTAPVADDLRPALEVGIAKPGTGFHTLRYWMVRFLHEFTRAWKRDLRGEDRERLLKDPWAFREFLFSLEMHAAQTQREALLHLVFPETFEPIVSERHKGQIVAVFDPNPPDPTENVDRRLARIRPSMAERFGEDFHYYRPHVIRHWLSDADDPWKELIRWAGRFIEWKDFDARERDYKLEFAAHLREARRSLENGDGAWDHIFTAFRGTNLVSWRVMSSLQEWLTQNAERADRALRTLWLGEGELRERIDGFVEQMADAPTGEKVRFAAALLMALDPTQHPPYAQEKLRKAYVLTGFGDPPAGATAGERYEHARNFFQRVFSEAEEEGLELRDILDAQAVAWSVLSYGLDAEPVSTWRRSERNRFLRFRGDQVPDGEDEDLQAAESGPVGRSTDLASLADNLLLPESFLTGIQRLLEAKRQVIFYGPPGTGKTYVARELAKAIASEGRVRLVQLHPSYTYEDFVEGYRPSSGDGASGFTLVPGALKRIARAAAADPSSTYILIIDELNRGNVAKVFGELYFLLEYRGESMDLQYSLESFHLPANLWIIGTMNTADRSIALMDAALRRRFYFVPFFPDHEPIRGLLGRWLEREKPALAWVADVVEEANTRLDDPHFAIGPSHFMRPDLDEEWVRMIWDHAIRPTLEEHFFGRESELERFRLSALRNGTDRDGDIADATPEDDDGAVAAAD